MALAFAVGLTGTPTDSPAESTAQSTAQHSSAAATDAPDVADATARPTSSGPEEPADAPSQDEVDAALAAVRPVVLDPAPESLQPLSDGAAVDPDVVAAELAEELDSSWLGPRVAIDIRDAATGDVVLQRNIDEPMIPASLTKVVAGAAVVRSFPMEETLTTRVVAGQEPGEIVLVAGGDSLLSAERGDLNTVAGRAGLYDLAEQVAEELHADQAPSSEAGADATADPTGEPGQQTPVRLYLDTSYAAGAPITDGWSEFWVQEGFTGRITMLGLTRDRASPYDPSPQDPEQSAAEAFIDALAEFDVEVEWEEGDDVPRLSELDRPAIDLEDPDTVVLGEVDSAPVREILAQALVESDNALTEQLVRIAAVRDGVETEPAEIAAWITVQIGEYGIDTTGMRLQNGSGLAGEEAVLPARVVTDILILAAGDEEPALREMVSGLPVSGLTGTLYDRFQLESHHPGRGMARAKTGALPGVTSLAGTVVTADGRALVFTVIADDVDQDGPDIVEARAVIDTMVTDLVRCGC